MDTVMDLAEYIQAEVDKPGMSYRKVAKHIGISKTTVEKIAKRKIVTMPEVGTLQKIADAYGMTLPTVIEMAGAMIGDNERYQAIARRMEAHPWIAARFDELASLPEEKFNDWLDQVAWQRQRRDLLDPTFHSPSE